MRDRSRSPHEKRRSRSDRDDRDRFRDSNRERERRHSSSHREREGRERRHSDDRRHSHSERSRSERSRSERSPEKRRRDRSRDRSRRDRSRERSRDHRDHHRDRPRSPDLLDLRTLGVSKLSEEDYYAKSGPFRSWLSAERGLTFTDLSSDEGRKYFRRFVRRWNDGALPRRYYDDSEVPSASVGPSRPSLPSHPTPAPGDAEASDEEIGPSLPFVVGPSRPSYSDVRYARETAQEQAQLERKFEVKSQRRAVYERAEELVPKMVGKEGKMAEKKAANAANKEMREKDTDAIVDEGTLLGDADGFAGALRAREAAAQRRAERKAEELAERRAAMDDRMAERKQKEAATMDMFKQLARQRFG